MPIPALPLFRHRDTVATPADQNQFVTQFENTMDTLSNDVIPALNLSINDINTQYNNIYNNLPFAPDSGYSQAYIDANIYKKTETYNKIEIDAATNRIGMIDYGYVAKNYHIVAFGGEFNRADYPKLWTYLQANPSLVKTQAQWQTEATANDGICGFYSNGNGTTTFRVPNLDGAFVRFSSRAVGSFEKDSLQSFHVGAATAFNVGSLGDAAGATSWDLDGGFTIPNLINWDAMAEAVDSYSISRLRVLEYKAGPVRFSMETRSKNIAVLPLIVAK